MIKGAIFDLDGTLLDSAWVWHKIDEDFLGSRGIKVPDNYIEEIAHLGFEATAIYTINRFGFDDTPEDLMRIWDGMAMKEYKENVMIKPHVIEYLEFLKNNGIKMGVATASYKELFMPCLIRNGIDSYFESYTTIAETKKPKDSPDVYLLAAKKLGMKPEECAVFEDLPQGINSAKKAGFITMAVPDSFTCKSLDELRKNADYVVTDYAYLLEKKIPL